MRRGWDLWVAVACLLIWLAAAWFAGTLLKLPSPDIWVLRGGLWLLGLAGFGGYLWWRKTRGTDDLPVPGESDELAVLWGEAGTRLRGSRLGPQARLEALPAFFLLGDSNSGKTTVAQQSGLGAELLAGYVPADGAASPTRLVNLWLAGGNLLVDPGGDLLQKQDREQLFQRFAAGGFSAASAPRAALLCVSCETLLQAGSSEPLLQHAKAARELLAGISVGLGLSFPIYVLFTKADHLSYFADFYSNYTDAEATELFGATLPLTEPGSAAAAQRLPDRLNEALMTMFVAMHQRRLEMLRRERDPSRLANIYEFPRETRKLRTRVIEFLVELNKPTQLRVQPFLRGFYFTGTRDISIQEAPLAPQQQVILPQGSGEATSIFSGPIVVPQSPQAPVWRSIRQWMFLPRLFPEVLLADRAALSRSSVTTSTDNTRRLLFGGALAVAIVLLGGWCVSFGGNRGWLGATGAAARDLAAAKPPAAGDMTSFESLRSLDALRQQAEALAKWDDEGAPWRLRWGLYAGSTAREPIEKIYFAQFRRLLLEPARASLLDTINKADPESVKDASAPFRPIYDALKAYLITSTNGDKSTAEFLAPVLLRHAARTPVDQLRLDLARRQFEYYANVLKSRNPYPQYARLDEKGVANARAYLSKFAAIESIYNAMLTEAGKQNGEVKFAALYPGSGDTLVDPVVVPGAFTKGGWAFMKNAIQNPDRYFSGERWVVGDQGAAVVDRARLAQDLTQRYRGDFVKAWRDFLKGGSLVRYAGWPDASKKLGKLSSNQSPLLALLCVVSSNTAIDDPDTAAIFQPAQTVVPPACKEKLVADANAGYMEALLKVQAAVDQVAQTPADTGAQSAVSTQASAAQLVTRTLAQKFRPDPDGQTHALVQKLLEDPLVWLQQAVAGIPKAEAGKKAAALCALLKPVQSKYPFDSKSTTPATVAELNSIFKPGEGAWWKFFDDNLKPMVIKQGSAWALSPNAPTQLTPQYLGFLNRMMAVSDAFYKGQPKDPQLTFALRPATADDVQELQLNLHGTNTKMRGGRGAAQSFSWPGTKPEARMTVKFQGGSEFEFPGQTGPWAVFQFFAQAEMWTPTDGGYAVEWTLRTAGGPVTVPKTGKPATVRMVLDMGGAFPVLRPGVLATLGCATDVIK